MMATVLTGLGLCAQLAVAQEQFSLDIVSPGVDSFGIAPAVTNTADTPLISISRNTEAKDIQGALVEDALQYNLGMKFEPLAGLALRADAWGLEVNEVPANGVVVNNLPQLYIEDSAINEFNRENPLLGTNIETNGFDLGASYVWDTNRFGQFTLSTTTTYVQEFENRGGLLELGSKELNAFGEKMISPELQSNLMLTWEFGKHSASAVTNYFDSYKDISELNIDEINDLVDNITTVDLQYGYSVKAGANDRAIIEFGIRNIFDEKTKQLLNSSTRILDQNGRVAYGSFKYQF
jgi:hypothetical protein